MDMLNISDGIRIIAKYMAEDGQAECRHVKADHYSLWVEGPHPKEMTEEDVALLQEHGWVHREDFVQASLLDGPAKRWQYRL